jgi:hypothetical protein
VNTIHDVPIRFEQKKLSTLRRNDSIKKIISKKQTKQDQTKFLNEESADINASAIQVNVLGRSNFDNTNEIFERLV